MGGQWPPGQISMQEMGVQKPPKVSLIASSWLIKLGFRPKSRGPLAAEEERQDVLVWHILSRVHLVGCSLPSFSCREKRRGIPGTWTLLVAWSS